MSTEAMKLALEALKDNQHLVADNERHAYVMEYNSIIEKLEETLAKQEQSAPRGGEPVNLAKFEGNVLLNIDGSLYTRPQQLVWFSLTDEEIQAIAFESADKESAVYKAEAKLKEKNTAP